MKVLFDTNVVIDIIHNREAFYADSYKALHLAFENCTTCISTTTITDSVYITRKVFTDSKAQKQALSVFFSKFKLCAVKAQQIKAAFLSPMSDFEDAVQAFCAKRHGVKYIITRNVKDYKLSPVMAIEPADFIKLFGNKN